MKPRSPWLQSLHLALACSLFFALMFAHVTLPLSLEAMQGVVGQGKVVISIYLVVFLKKRGYITACILNALDFIEISAYMIASGDPKPLPGLVIPLTTALIVSILAYYTKHLNRQIAESQRKQEALELNAARLNQLAFYDPLTGLWNRESILTYLDELCGLAQKNEESFALVFIDMDDFKYINDTMGHVIGDQVLRAIALRFGQIGNPNVAIGRVGGDEFALLIRRESDEEAIIHTVSTYRQALSKIRLEDGRVLSVNACFGVAFCPRDSLDGTELIKCADTAMYRAKADGKGRIQVFSGEIREELLRRVEMENELVHAMERGEFSIVFQPQFYVANHQVRGYEALTRWNSSVLGAVSPGQFIPMAEANGMILRLGDWILEEACRVFVAEKARLDPSCCLSVNLSVKQIADPDFPGRIHRILRRTGMSPKHLELEITESLFISEVESAMKALEEIRGMGIRLALDDFGTGYSSLYLLQKMPIDTLKIDKAFIQDLDQGEKIRQVAISIIRLVHRMGITVVAEGVENEAQLEFLRQNGCDCLQGFLWGKPAPFSHKPAGPVNSNCEKIESLR